MSRRREAEVGPHGAGAPEVLRGFDRSRKARSHDHADSRAGHQQTAGRIPLGEADQPPVEHRNLLPDSLPRCKQRIDDGASEGLPFRSSRTRVANGWPAPLPALRPKVFKMLRIWLERSTDTPLSWARAPTRWRTA